MKPSARFHSARNALNNQIIWPILLVLFLAPFAFGSTKPAFWTLWSTILFGCGTYVFARMAIVDAQFRISPRSMPVSLTLFAALGLYMLVQIIPLGSLAPVMPAGTQGVFEFGSGAISLAPNDTLLAAMRWATYGLLFFLVLQATANQQRARLFLKILFWSIVLHAIIALLFLLQFGDTILGIPKWKYFGDALGGFINRNSFATFLAMGCVIGLNFLLPGNGAASMIKTGRPTRIGRDTVFIGVGLLILLVALIATNSRMGAFAAICGMAMSLGLALSKRLTGFRAWPLVALLLAAIVFAVITYGATFTERLGRAGDDAAIRQQLYAQVIDMIGLRPLLGYGGDSFEYVFLLFHQPPVSVDLVWSKTHSTYLALWSDYGLVFGSLPILLIGFLFFQLLSTHRMLVGQDALIRCGIGAIVTGAVHSLVDFSLEIEAVTFVFVALLAVACARSFEVRTAAREENP
ncbi:MULTISPECIES: O-antigen ligase family protein [unclassified Rhizobium]|uniref:O-antigen ligase family protein n=1 Tax=unclassified Rhizobium TaxID=2613769 RepID=UPI000700C590|nr:MULTISPECIES: O-antigen ligase family protein [unclassified Rhizobium]KQV44416.1 hypothetical protein ASC86_06565 [Rhizobium sp. Root1212]KRD38597.1 hypothetical protein ASE37_06565 [Rhizobium sp. Root268]